MTMKKFIGLSLFALLICVNTMANKLCECGDPTNLEITLRDVTGSSSPEIQRRVQAFMDFDMDQVTVQFNASVGNEVTVTIMTISGATISMTVCDSEVEPLVSLPLPPKGAYILKVESETYEGEGTFAVQ